MDLDDHTPISTGSRPSFNQKTQSHSSTIAKSPPIFGSDISLSTQLAHGTILISTDESAQPLVYGNIPLVIVSCGSYLKKNALETEGIFRVGGSSKRLKSLQDQFSTPPDYGSNVDWSGFTVHDAASLLRRYLTALPEPLVPLDLYFKFRESLLERPHLVAYLKEKEQKMAASIEQNEKFEPRQLTKEEKKLVLNERKSLLGLYAKFFDEIKPIQRRTLFYILDLLALFHLNSKVNRMSAKNLSYIFQPSVIFHPDHELSPDEYAISGLVLEFCITYSYKILAKVQEQAITSILPVTPTTGSRPHSKSLSQMNDTSHLIETPKPLTVPQAYREQSISSINSNDFQSQQQMNEHSNTQIPQIPDEKDLQSAESFSIQSSKLEGHIDN